MRCGLKLGSDNDIDRHIGLVHKVRSVPTTCFEITRTAYLTHCLQEDAKRKYVCDFCGGAFLDEQHLSGHMSRVHISSDTN